METPHTKAGQVTEQIMEIFYGIRREKSRMVELTTQQYNAVYSHVLDTLTREYGQYHEAFRGAEGI